MPQPNGLLLRSSCGGVSNAFSKSKMNVSICPPPDLVLDGERIAQFSAFIIEKFSFIFFVEFGLISN